MGIEGFGNAGDKTANFKAIISFNQKYRNFGASKIH